MLNTLVQILEMLPLVVVFRLLKWKNYDERAAQTEDTWRPWEHRRYQVDRKIMQVEANVDPGPDYSVDFLEPNTALTPEAEIAVWEWRFNRGLATPKDWFLLKQSRL